MNKRDGETTGIYTELGKYLGDYFDNMYKCMAILEEEERRSRTEIYQGDASLGKRALERVLMKKQLEKMGTELREMMVYNAPAELGALWSDVETMMKEMGVEQKILLTKKLREDARAAERRKAKFKMYMTELSYGILAFVFVITMIALMAWVSHDRKQRWPDLEPDVIAKKQEERKRIRLIELQDYQEKLKREDAEFRAQANKLIEKRKKEEELNDQQE